MKIRTIAIYTALLRAEKDPLALKRMNKELDKLIAYEKHVYSMPQRMQLIRARAVDNDECHYLLMQLDTRRRVLHDEAISALKVLELDVMGDLTDKPIESTGRSEIADAIFEFVHEWTNSYGKGK